MHSFVNYSPFALLILPLLFLFFVTPVVTLAEEHNSETVKHITPAKPTKSPVSVPLRRSQMVPKENGLQGQYFFLKRPAMGISLTYK